jgi:hypothetical protein
MSTPPPRANGALGAPTRSLLGAVHGDYSLLAPFEDFKASFETFEPITFPVPSIGVDTTDGYEPTVEEIVVFLSSGSRTAEAG